MRIVLEPMIVMATFGRWIAHDFDRFTSAFQMHGEAPNAILAVRVQHDLFEQGSQRPPQFNDGYSIETLRPRAATRMVQVL